MSVYLRAAQLLPAADGTLHPMGNGCDVYGCCDALQAVGAEPDDFEDMFEPDDASSYYYWFGHEPSDRRARVLALLLMHWMTVNP